MSIPTFPEPTLVPVHGVELEVFEFGRQHAGNPMVVCHGWPDHAFTWRHQVPALVDAGYHVIAPNQRGYGNSSRPADVAAYGIDELTGDLVGLLDHFGYEQATYMGHDWGAMVVWGLALLHPQRVSQLVALSVPYQVRTEQPWIAFLEGLLGSDYYFVHFNRHPGVADAVLDANTARFLRNLYRKNEPILEPPPGNAMIELALAETALGDPILSERELAVLVEAFERSGFGPSIHWYRNLDRNWHRLADVDPVVQHPALMIYGARDAVQQADQLAQFVPNVEVVELDCGHWIHQEMPEATNRAVVDWLHRAR
ncbi:MAG: alpha/beta hydrolase [Myxococcota bacterium]